MTLFPPETFADVIQTALKAANITAKEASIKLGYVNPSQLEQTLKKNRGFRLQTSQDFIEKICQPYNYDPGYSPSGLTLLSRKDSLLNKACDAGKIILSNLLVLHLGILDFAKELNKSVETVVSIINGNYEAQSFDKVKKEINDFFYRNSVEGDELPDPFPEVIEPSLMDVIDETKGVWISFEELDRLEEFVTQIKKRINQ